MDSQARAQLERRCKESWDAGRIDETATEVVRGYGPEVLGYLAATLGAESEASEVFSIFCEDLWRGLPNFRWDCSLRTWAYTLARHAMYRVLRSPARRRKVVPLSDSPEVYELAEQVRTATLLHLRTEVKDAVSRLRDQLEPEERSLLVLRVDRKMSWASIARIMADASSEAESSQTLDVKKLSATLRKRFERSKEKLRALAIAEGLLD